ncbi:hypothetical protein AMS68_001451 [Peltaster fructicola]|uniref:NmrA-like domain-containing protein n=1 Tax=Peltaster fructicola TaxID=286661 RepID=A0A6H0XMI2_9PEZI|nr:hypothetical protein AMS68_001451 [Peltaster fructicola]
MSLRSILVVGATGQQGGALISALTADSRETFQIYALTRSKTSSSAQRLAQQNNVSVIEGDLDHPEAVFKQINKPLWGLFAVTVLDKGHEKEELQGRALIKAAVEAKVAHIVFTATDRGGQVKSENNPSDVPHFVSKYNIEQVIKENAAKSNGKLTYTFLRPVSFYENFNPKPFGPTHMTMWRMDGDDKTLQMIATKDVGKVAAEAFRQAEDSKYKNNAVSLAGDSVTAAEFRTIFKRVTGQDFAQSFWILGAAIRYGIKDLRRMYHFFAVGGFGVDVPKLKKEYPFMMDLETWLREESVWKK